jgi:DNA-binding CsgD family transcriptional regulator
MPRKSPFEIVLSPTEKAELTQRARKYTLAYFLVQRAKIILLAAEGLSNSEIAKRLDTRREVVTFWRKRFLEKRLAGLDDRDRSGRPRVFPPRSHNGSQSSGL